MERVLHMEKLLLSFAATVCAVALAVASPALVAKWNLCRSNEIGDALHRLVLVSHGGDGVLAKEV